MSRQSPDRIAGDATAVSELPPSAKLVVKTLEYEGELTQSQLAAETLLASRTVRSALTKLEEAGIVTSRTSFVDARKTLYSLDPDRIPDPQES